MKAILHNQSEGVLHPNGLFFPTGASFKTKQENIANRKQKTCTGYVKSKFQKNLLEQLWRAAQLQRTD